MESEHGIATNSDLNTHPVISISSVHISSSDKKLSSSSFASSSSSPDSPLEDPFQDDEIELHGSSPNSTDNAQLASKTTDIAPELGLNNGSAIDSPPIQTMDRSNESTYRIPSSVFERTKSTTPVDWSVASNESLFSIHMGNMSFSKDHIFWRSGELGLPVEVSTSGQFFNFPPNHLPTNEANGNGKSSEGFSVAEAAVETMKEVLRENAEVRSSKSLSFATTISHRSNESTTSIKSFAFPILTGDIDKGTSVKISGSARVVPEQLRTQSEPQTPVQLEPKTPAAKPEKAWTTWFSCFSCCPLRC